MSVCIILEGNECTFKSTLAELLSKELNIPVKKGSSFEAATKPNDQLYKWYQETFGGVESTIYDRGFYSNLVYASLFESHPVTGAQIYMLEQDQIYALEEMLLRNYDQVIVVFCTAPTDVLKSRLAERGDENINAEELEEISERYYEVIVDELVDRKSGPELILYETVYRTPEEFTNYFKYFIKKGSR
jgi:thymidylate kinase